jgi:hypothetical protein
MNPMATIEDIQQRAADYGKDLAAAADVIADPNKAIDNRLKALDAAVYNWLSMSAKDQVADGTNGILTAASFLVGGEAADGAKLEEAVGADEVKIGVKAGDATASIPTDSIATSEILDGETPPEGESWSVLPEVSDDFQNRVSETAGRILSRLSAQEQSIARQIMPKAWDSVASKFGEGKGYEHTVGTFVQAGANDRAEIDISEYFKMGGSWYRNNVIDGTICHEIGHAVDVMDRSQGVTPLCEMGDFKTKFAEDWYRVMSADENGLMQLFNRKTFWKTAPDDTYVMKGENHVLDFTKVRDEVFAELFAAAKKYDPATNFAVKLRRYFIATFEDYMKGKYASPGSNHTA